MSASEPSPENPIQPALPEPVGRQRRSTRSEVKSVIHGFFEFFQTYSVLPLAIGVVVGSAVNDLVKSLVDGIISPLVSLVTPTSNLAIWVINIHGSVFKIGAVINSLLNFFFVALTVYIVVKVLLRRELPPPK